MEKVLLKEVSKKITLDNMMGVIPKFSVEKIQLEKLIKYQELAIGGMKKADALAQSGLTTSKLKTLSKIHNIPSPYLGDGAGRMLKRKKSNQVKSGRTKSKEKSTGSSSRENSKIRILKGGKGLIGTEYINQFKDFDLINESESNNNTNEI